MGKSRFLGLGEGAIYAAISLFHKCEGTKWFHHSNSDMYSFGNGLTRFLILKNIYLDTKIMIICGVEADKWEKVGF